MDGVRASYPRAMPAERYLPSSIVRIRLRDRVRSILLRGGVRSILLHHVGSSEASVTRRSCTRCSCYCGVEVVSMRNVTFSADERIIEAARARARQERTTLNEQFRRWLEAYATREDRARDAMRVVEELRTTVRTGGRRFTRDERNER